MSVRGCSRSARAFALLALAFAALLAFGALPARAADVPFLTGRVVDNAEILSAATRERLAAVMKAHKRTANWLPDLWWIEGFAEYMGTNWDEEAEGLLRDMVLTGHAYPKPQRVSRAPRNLALHRFESGDLEAALRAAGMPDISRQDAERLIEVTELQAYKRMASGLTCGDVMVRNVYTITGATTVDAALRLMERHDINALPVVDRDNRVLGLLRTEEATNAAPGTAAEAVMMIDYFRRASDAPAAELVVGFSFLLNKP